MSTTNTFFKTIRYASFIFALSFGLVSCGGDDDDRDLDQVIEEIEESNDTFTALVDGDTFVADEIIALNSESTNFFQIIAKKEDGSNIDFAIPLASVNTFEATGDFDTQVIATHRASSSTVYTALSGSVTITDISPLETVFRTIKGTFSFTFTDTSSGATVEATNGTFEVAALSL